MCFMGPVVFTPEKECYSVLTLQFFLGADIQERSVSDTFGTKNAGQSLEELVQLQALSDDLREAVMACLCGRESRRWTIAELVERLFSGKTWVGLAGVDRWSAQGSAADTWAQNARLRSCRALRACRYDSWGAIGDHARIFLPSLPKRCR